MVTGGESCLIPSRVGRVSLHNLVTSFKEAFLKGKPKQLGLDGVGRNAYVDLRECHCAAVDEDVLYRRMLHPCGLVRLDLTGRLTIYRQMCLRRIP